MDANQVERVAAEIRAAWCEWARTQTNPKPSWLVPWESLDEQSRDADRHLARWHLAALAYARSFGRNPIDQHHIESQEPAPAPSGPETPWERYMRQEWPMDRDRFNALVAAEVARATAEWKARAEKAEAALRERDAALAEARDLVREGRELAYDRMVRLRNREEQGKADLALKRVEAFDFLRRALLASVAVTQAHEERRPVLWFIENTSGLWLHKSGDQHTNVPGEAMSFRSRDDAELRIDEIARASARPHATRSFYRPTSHMFLEDEAVMASRAAVTQAHEEAGARVARKTQEPPSAVGNTLPRAEPDGGGGSATPTWADLRPWLAFVEALADGYRNNMFLIGDAARALLVATKKEGK